MKIAVGRALEDAYSFAFKRFFSVLGTVWFPYLILFVIFGCVFVTFFAQFGPLWIETMRRGPFETRSMDPEMMRDMFRHMTSLVGFAPLLLLVALVVRSMVLVGLLQLALDQREGPVFVYFSLGAPVWRLFGAFLLACVIIWIIAAVLAGLCVAIWFGVHTFPQPNLLRGLAILIAVCLLVYTALRLIFFLPAVVVAEGHIGLGRAWELGGGNFWRMVITLLATFIPAAIVFSIVSGAVRAAMFAPLLPQLDDHHTTQQLWSILTHQGVPYIIVAVLLQLLYSVILAGLGAGMIASAYRSVLPPVAESSGMAA